MKAYVTKYALTQGIIEVDGEIANTCSTMFCSKTKDGYTQHWHKSDWWHTLAEAHAHAELMRTKKIDSLKRKIKQLESRHITVRKQ